MNSTIMLAFWLRARKPIARIGSAIFLTACIMGCSGGSSESSIPSAPASPPTVTVPPSPVATVVIAAPQGVKTSGQMQTLPLAIGMTDLNGNILSGRVVTWSSSNPAVASVSAGTVSGGSSSGQATITATSEGYSDAITITVNPWILVPLGNIPGPTISIDPNSPTVQVGKTVTLTATVFAHGTSGSVLTNQTLTWQSGNTNIATVQSTGAGTVTILGNQKGLVRISANGSGISSSVLMIVTP